MMKFFRKHNKELLAFFMVLLMVVFLGGSALSSLLQPDMNRVVATTRVGDVSFKDQRAAEATTQFLTSMGVNWQFPAPGVQEPLELIDWILLTREARLLGTASSIRAIHASMNDRSGVAELARRLRVKPDRVYQALADYQSVVQTAQVLSGATVPSEAAVLAAVRDTTEQVDLKVVMLPAEVFVDDAVPFNEDEIVAQYEKYREREAGPGLNFGYFVPPMLRVQYIEIDRDKLAHTVRIANLQKKAKKLYKEERERNPVFRRSAEEMAELEGQSVEAPFLEKPSPYLSWEEAKDKAVELVRQQAATEAAARMADWIMQSVTTPWLEAQRGKDGYKPAPESVTSKDYYEKVIGNLPPSLTYPDAVKVRTSEFFARADAPSVSDIGKAYYVDSRQAGRMFTLGDLAFQSQPIVPKVPEERNTRSEDYLSLYQTSRYLLRDGKANVYVFRVVESRAAHVPKSLDEVRDKVVHDLRLKKGYDEALRAAEALSHCESTTTLREAYDADVTLVERINAYGRSGAGFVEPPPVSRATQYAASLGASEDTINVGSEVGPVPADVVESWFTNPLIPGGKSVVELPGRAVVMVVERESITRTTPHDLDTQRKSLTDLMMRLRSAELVREWFKPDNIRARNGFQLLTS